MAQTPWELLQAGNSQEAFRELRDAYAKKGTSSHIMELGVAYLWVRDYQAAWEHFCSANQRYPKHADVFYGMAGAAKWCLDKPAESVQQWFLGLDCHYADGAGGVQLPLLLFFASVVNPHICDRREAEKLLESRARDRRAANWPGALADFLSGRIDIDGLRGRCTGRNESDTMLRHWLAGFYLGVVERSSGNIAGFKKLMQKTAITSQDDFDITKRHYLGKLWYPELHIARYETDGFLLSR